MVAPGHQFISIISSAYFTCSNWCLFSLPPFKCYFHCVWDKRFLEITSQNSQCNVGALSVASSLRLHTALCSPFNAHTDHSHHLCKGILRVWMLRQTSGMAQNQSWGEPKASRKQMAHLPPGLKNRLKYVLLMRSCHLNCRTAQQSVAGEADLPTFLRCTKHKCCL